MSRRALGAALALVLALSGCGAGDGDDASSTTTAARQQPQVIVQAAAPGFDAAEVYREASPGVVTIRSIFSTGAAEGSGFVLDTEGRIVTNAHVVTDGEGRSRKPAKAVFIEFPDRNILNAEIVGFDPFADVALLRVEPDGFDLHRCGWATTRTWWSASRWRRSAVLSASSSRSRWGSSRPPTARWNR